MADYDERETVVRWGQRSDRVSVWTCIPSQARKIGRAGFKPDRVSKAKDGQEVGWWYELPVKKCRLLIRKMGS